MKLRQPQRFWFFLSDIKSKLIFLNILPLFGGVGEFMGLIGGEVQRNNRVIV